ncbi:glycosyltransferase [Planctomycetota bacterium]
MLSVVVCTFNRARLLRECLDSLVVQSVDGTAFEVVVVDNNSSDDTELVCREYASKHPFVRYCVERIQGHAHARNRGWREAAGEYVAYTDDDCVVAPDWCQRILKSFHSLHPTPDALGGKILPRYERQPPRWFTDDFEIRSWGEESRFLVMGKDFSGFSGANMAFRREVLSAVGGFSERFGIVSGKLVKGEDTEVFHRLVPRFSRFWYDKDLTVRHWTPASFLRMRHRVTDAFRGGQGLARLDSRSAFSPHVLVRLLSFSLLLPEFAVRFVQEEGTPMARAVRASSRLAHRAGFVWAKLSAMRGAEKDSRTIPS